MTFLELSRQVTLHEYSATEGDNLQKVARRVYKSTKSIYIKALVALNKKIDWNYLKSGEIVVYIKQQDLQQVDESV